MDILKSKIRSSVMPDALVMRTIFDIIDSPPKSNVDYKDESMLPNPITIESLLLSSSLVSNQTFVFETTGTPSANVMLQAWQDMCVAVCTLFWISSASMIAVLLNSGAWWKNIDKWMAFRLGKTSELTARIAAQITHLGLGDKLLQEFLNQHSVVDTLAPVSYETYHAMADFCHDMHLTTFFSKDTDNLLSSSDSFQWTLSEE